MSRWLNQVGSLLEKLDDKAGSVAEERAFLAQEEAELLSGLGGGGGGGGVVSSIIPGLVGSSGVRAPGSGGSALDEILAKRGLSALDDDPHEHNGDDHDDQEEEEEQQVQDANSEPPNTTSTDPNDIRGNDGDEKSLSNHVPSDSKGQKGDGEVITEDMKEHSREPLHDKKQPAEVEVKESSVSRSNQAYHKSLSSSSSSAKNASSKPTTVAPFSLQLSPPPKPLTKKDEEPSSKNGQKKDNTEPEPSSSQPQDPPKIHKEATSKTASNDAVNTVKTPTKSKPSASAVTPSRQNQQREKEELLVEIREAQKESRTLRRHVVALNEQLEAAEAELQAQRVELDRAAERMEKDRKRAKEDKEKGKKQHADEIASLKSQHDKNLKEQKDRMEEQLEAYRKRLAEEEKLRKQEGGDWNKEMSDAIEREQQMRHTVTQLEDERSVLLAQISTLQGQQTALGSRLESLTQANENAMARERDAEDRLDAALNQHARQMSQRQAREAELERTIQELNSALVTRGSSGSLGSSSSLAAGGADGGDAFSAKIATLQIDLETANSQLAMERERSETLQMQLRDLSKETTQEATEVHAKQIQYDRQIAELNLTISKLQAKLQDAEKARLLSERSNGSHSNDSENDRDMSNQVKLLSEEVVRLRDKVANYNSESLAMKHRLKVATDRANKAEDDLALAMATAPRSGDFDVESGSGTLSKRRRGGTSNQSGSIKSALRLEGGLDPRTQQLGEVVDAVDSFAVSTGKYLRKNPLARAGFICYLSLIHAWTFVLLFFHAHNFEVEHGDFGAGIGMPHGPHALMQQRQPVILPAGVNADASVAKPDSVDSAETSKDDKYVHPGETKKELTDKEDDHEADPAAAAAGKNGVGR